MYRQRLTQFRTNWLTLITVLAVAGCATGNPISIAETPSQKGYAIEKSYNIILEGAVDLVADSSTPNSVKMAIGRAEAAATPVIDSLSQSLADYVVARAQFEAGMSTEAKLDAVSRNLAGWITQAERALLSLATAIDGGG